ncbi:MAG: hypothetical protein IPL10_13670 [Bacteroidetes bacterium]|nr:hypothetical protein [Bacteroidota bacterium]
MNSKTLILFTNTFPYSKGEEFLETEILFLADSFKQIVIYPFNQEGERRKLPDNVTVKTIAFSNDLSSKNIILKYWIQILHVLKYELLFSKYRMVF